MGRCHGRSSYNYQRTTSSKYPVVQWTGNYETSFYAHHFKPSTVGSYGNRDSIFAPRFSLYSSSGNEPQQSGEEQIYLH